MFGIDLHSEYVLPQLALLLVLAAVLFAHSYHDYKVRTAAVITPSQLVSIFKKMEEHRTDQEMFREQYHLYLRQGLKTPWGLLSAMAYVTSLKYHGAGNNYYFYNTNSGFITMIPLGHIDTSQ